MLKVSTNVLILVLALALLTISCHPAPSVGGLTRQINRELGQQQGTFAVAFKDLNNGREIRILDKEMFHTASTMKTCVLIELYKQASLGKLSLTDSLVVRNDFRSIVDGTHYHLDANGDGDVGLYQLVGRKVPLSNLAYRMITVSSNLATNLLIELVGAANVTATMRKLGADDIEVLRGVEDPKAYEKGLNNKTTAHDLMIIFEKIAKGRAVGQKASEEMIAILLDQKFSDVIPARLPKEAKVAHKTGNFTGVQHDSGIVYAPGGKKYVLVLMSKGLVDEKASKAAMARVSELIYLHVTTSK